MRRISDSKENFTREEDQAPSSLEETILLPPETRNEIAFSSNDSFSDYL